MSKFAILRGLTQPHQVTRTVQDVYDGGRYLVRNTPAREIAVHETSKRFDRFTTDVEMSYRTTWRDIFGK